MLGGHAVVGVIGMHGALLARHSFCTSNFRKLFRLVRALRVILPLATGGIAHLFVVYWYQGLRWIRTNLLSPTSLWKQFLVRPKLVELGRLSTLSLGSFLLLLMLLPVAYLLTWTVLMRMARVSLPWMARL